MIRAHPSGARKPLQPLLEPGVHVLPFYAPGGGVQLVAIDATRTCIGSAIAYNEMELEREADRMHAVYAAAGSPQLALVRDGAPGAASASPRPVERPALALLRSHQ